MSVMYSQELGDSAGGQEIFRCKNNLKTEYSEFCTNPAKTGSLHVVIASTASLQRLL